MVNVTWGSAFPWDECNEAAQQLQSDHATLANDYQAVTVEGVAKNYAALNNAIT